MTIADLRPSEVDLLLRAQCYLGAQVPLSIARVLADAGSIAPLDAELDVVELDKVLLGELS